MATDDNPLHDLTPPQLVERALDLRHEVDYWQSVLEDCGTIGDELHSITESLLSSTIAAGALLGLTDDVNQAVASQVLEANGKAMPAVMRSLRLVLGLIELANGRGLALDRTIEALDLAAGGSVGTGGESVEP